jgi:acyl-CoA thioesterase II
MSAANEPHGLFSITRAADTTFVWSPPSHVLTPGRFVQGGAGLGVALEAMEQVTGRPTIWGTAQYLSFAAGTDPIDITVNVEVAGRNTTQARAVLSREGNEILTAHAAFGRRSDANDRVWSRPPNVSGPEDCPRYRFFETTDDHLGGRVELRLAHGRQLSDIDRPGDGTFALWVRCWSPGEHQITTADLAFIGDFMPLGFAEAMGQPFAGNSLDNTIRVGRLVPTDWVLLSTQVQQVAHGFGYGRAEMWSHHGELLGEVSQSSILRMHRRITDEGDRLNP